MQGAGSFSRIDEGDDVAVALPRELFVAIFSKLPQSELLTVIPRVCKAWRRHVYVPELWTSFGSRIYRPFHWSDFDRSVLRHMLPLHPDLTSLDLSLCVDYHDVSSPDQCTDFTDSLPAPQVCRQLRSLTLPIPKTQNPDPELINRAVALLNRLDAVSDVTLSSPNRHDPRLGPRPISFALRTRVPDALLHALPPGNRAPVAGGNDGHNFGESDTPPAGVRYDRWGQPQHRRKPNGFSSLVVDRDYLVNAEKLTQLVRRSPDLETLSACLLLETCFTAEVLFQSLFIACPKIHTLHLDAHDLGFSADACAALLTLPYLNSLSLERCHVDESLLSQLTSRLSVVSVASDLLTSPHVTSAPNLTCLRIVSRELRSINITSCPRLSDVSLTSGSLVATTTPMSVTLRTCPRVTSLFLTGFCHWSLGGDAPSVTSIVDVVVPTLEPCHVTSIPPNVERLTVQGDQSFSVHVDTVTSLVGSFPNLQSLKVDGLFWRSGSDSDSDLAGAGGRSGAAPPPPPTNHRVATVCPPSLRELTVGRWGDAAPTAVHVVSGPSGTPGPGIALSPPPWGHFGRASPVEWTIWASSLSLIQLRGFGSMDLDAKAKALALPEAAQGPGGDGHVMVT